MAQMVIDPGFWKGRRVLLTGHTGFKGSWMSLWLTELGADLTGLALPPDSDPSLFEMAGIAGRLQHRVGDVRDLSQVDAAYAAAKPEIVIHMAAQPLVRRSYVEPLQTLDTNIMGTAHVLDAARRHPDVRVALMITSDKCYENREWPWAYRETDPMGGHDIYSASKGCAELVTSAYRRSFFSDAAKAGIFSARAGNVIGGGDWAEDRLIPDLVRSYSRSQPLVIRNPHAVRPWQHVLESLSGYLGLVQTAYGKPANLAPSWNFGPSEDDCRDVGFVAESCTRLWGDGARWIHEPAQGRKEATLLKLDCSQARMLLGWRPRWRLEKALDMTIDWYRHWHAGDDMTRFTLAQIHDYQFAENATGA